MKLIIGLGNPGVKHIHNRHNVGHLFVDFIKDKFSKKFILVKTNTFMNSSGEDVQRLVNKYKVSMDDLYIVHDDLDIKLGEYKIQKGKGPKIHNGLKSIDEKLGTNDYWHVRIGVDNRNPENRVSGEEYVLEDFIKEESVILNNVFVKVSSVFS